MGNQLKDMQDFAKKRQKGIGAFVNPNAGDVEKGNAMFNNATDVGLAPTSGGISETLAESMIDRLEKNDYDFFVDYNNRYKNGEFYGTEAELYNLDNIKKWISIRDNYKYINNYVKGDWYVIPLHDSKTKYGTNYVYIEPTQKLWRIRETGDEYYNDKRRYYDFNESLIENTDPYSDNFEYTLQSFADQIDVVGPEYRGAPYPSFNECAINESTIPDNMRCKYVDVSVEGDTIKLDWITQEEFDISDANEFLYEINRAIECLIEECDFNQPFKILVKAESRDGAEFGHFENELEFNINSLKENIEEPTKEETSNNTNKFMSGQFTDDELIQLREDIVLGSLFTNDYKNRFDIDEKLIQDFFDGFIDYLDEAQSFPEEDDDFSDNGDNITMLSKWYSICDYSDMLNEDINIDLRKALNDLDQSIMTTDFVNMYDSANLSEEDKIKLANMLTSDNKDINDIHDFLAEGQQAQHIIKYKDMLIEYDFYNHGEYTVQYQGDDIWFDTLDAAKKFIDEIQGGIKTESLKESYGEYDWIDYNDIPEDLWVKLKTVLPEECEYDRSLSFESKKVAWETAEAIEALNIGIHANVEYYDGDEVYPCWKDSGNYPFLLNLSVDDLSILE